MLPYGIQIFNAKTNNNHEIKEFRALYKYFNIRLNTEDTPIAHVNFFDFYNILNDILLAIVNFCKQHKIGCHL